MDYKQCFVAHRQTPTQITLTNYLDSHNAYVQQLHATNAMMETYHMETIPQMTQELEQIYGDLCVIVADSVLVGADVISSRVSLWDFHIFDAVYLHFWGCEILFEWLYEFPAGSRIWFWLCV